MSKTIYIAGASRTVDGVRIPKDKNKTGYERFVPDGTLPDGSVIPSTVVTDTTAVAPKSFASGTYLQNGMTVSVPGSEPPEYDTPTVSVSIALSSDQASVQANASAVANGKTGTGSATKTLASMGLVKPAKSFDTKQTYNAGDEIAAGTYLKLGASIAEAAGGLPFIAEYDYQTYTPSANVSDNLTFNFTQLTSVPDMIIISAGKSNGSVNNQFGGALAYYKLFGMLQPGSNYFSGAYFSRRANYSTGWTVNALTESNITNVTKSGFTFAHQVYGGKTCYWVANWTYHIIAMKFKIPG